MARRSEAFTLEDDPLWFKDAIIYEMHVRAFYDSDGDGIGDFRGLAQKLDYLSDLGITALWLLPFYPSPLRDDGYDIADYANVHPSYGTLSDFHAFLSEAHKRGIRVITELVINHTSDQHPWFQRARTPGVARSLRDFYVWSDTPERYKDARVIFKDFESSNWSWDPQARAYYWHRFYAHQPDLNFENPQVRRAVFRTLDFWMRMGVDGLRLDAVPYLFEREGTTCENLPETHAFLKQLRAHVDSHFKNRMLLAEANQWPEDSIEYLGEGDECHMAFHFPVMPRLFMAIRLEDRFPIIDILQQTPPIPESTQWALFLRNHDELTLEMVTDEDRDYMYRAYANDPQMRINLGIRRRLAPLLGNHRRRIELMNGLLFSLPGTPVIYYGDELGMGDNIYLGDRNGVRTPMQWSPDRNAGFSRANPQRLYLPVIIDPEYHYEAVNVEAQLNNGHSLLWWTKRLIALRKRHKVFGRGTLEFLHPENRKVLAYIRRHEEEMVLVVANLSRFAQAVELNLSAFKGMAPVEMFGHTEFPPIGELPYFITLGPHAFYWFMLQPQRIELQTESRSEGATARTVPLVQTAGPAASLFAGRSRVAMEGALRSYLASRRWFAGKARTIQTLRVEEAIEAPHQLGQSFFVLIRVEYTEGDGETYVLPVQVAPDEGPDGAAPDGSEIIARARLRAGTPDETHAVLYDALLDRRFVEGLPLGIARRRRFGDGAEIIGSPEPGLRRLLAGHREPLAPTVLRGEQSNSSIVYEDKLIVKLYRKVEQGVNPELEISRFLTSGGRFTHTPALLGAMELRRGRSEPSTLGIVTEFVPNQGNAWSYTLDALGQYFERVLALGPDATAEEAAVPPPARLARSEPPERAYELIDTYMPAAELLGRRTAELHLGLASDAKHPAFAPEPLTPYYQRSLYQAVRREAAQALRLLRRVLPSLPEATQERARRFLSLESAVMEQIGRVLDRRLTGMRIRVHNDYHLGQVLYTGKDFVIIDFEGEPARPLSERRIKRSPLRDVAGMLRSFDYAAHAALLDQAATILSPEDVQRLQPWAAYWQAWVGARFLHTYLDLLEGSGLLPERGPDLECLLDTLVLEKGLYEMSYELNNRPAWVDIPLRGLLALIETE